MKQLFLVVSLLVSLACPVTAQAQGTNVPTPAQIAAAQSAANQAGQNAQGYNNQASGLEAQAQGLRSQAAAEQQRSIALQQQAQAMSDYAAASAKATEAQQAAGRAQSLYGQAAQQMEQAVHFRIMASQEWQKYKALDGQVVQMVLAYGHGMTLAELQHQLNEAQLSGQVFEQRNTINMQTALIENQSRLILGAGLLALALVMAIVWLVIRKSQQDLNLFALAFEKAGKRNDMAVVNDRQVRSYSILDQAAHESNTR